MRLTQKKAAYWLSEAWGQPIKPKHVRVAGNWIFVFDPEYPKEATCVHAPCGDIWAEPWDDIPIAKSPFVETNPSAILATLDTLDKAMEAYKNE